MSHLNKEVSNDSSVMKDKRIEFRVSQTEKEIFEEKAKKKNMSLSEYILATLRGDILKEELQTELGSGSIDISIVLKRIDQLEKMLSQNISKEIGSIRNISPEHTEDLLLHNACDKVYWMLQQEQFQKQTHKEIKTALIAADPSLSEFLKESTSRMFTALDLALEKLREEKRWKITRKGIISWLK